jgi:hypothetical protein
VLHSLNACKKDKTIPELDNTQIDHGEKYYGTYVGTQIYTDQQQMISDTTTSSIVLSKFENDTLRLVKMTLPTSDVYYYEATENDFTHYGQCYHCPIISIQNDSITGFWAPSLAPRRYDYYMVKQ